MSTLLDTFRRVGGVGLAVTVLLLLAPAVASGQKNLGADDIIFHFHGPDTTAKLGYYLNGLGDINGDGFDDVAVCSPVLDSTYIFYGGNPTDSFPDYVLPGGNGPPAMIDLDGDGIDDLVTSKVTGIAIDLRGVLFFFKGYGDSIGSVPYDSLSQTADNWGFGTWFELGYTSGDSLGDILVESPLMVFQNRLQLFRGGALVEDSVAWTYFPATGDDLSDSFGFIDFNGDGVMDIFAGHKWRDTGFVAIFLGPDFSPEPDIRIGPPAQYDTLFEYFSYPTSNLGDIDGDGWDDLGVCWPGGSIGRGFIYSCRPGADTVYDYELSQHAYRLKAAGDINGDGYNDLAAEGSLGGEFLSLELYLGGPVFDVDVDDFILRSDLPPIYLEDIAYRVCSAGDFNGDGYDDVLFACDNFAYGHPGDVFIVAGGPKIITGIDDKPRGNLPDHMRLYQNYPNPFNPSTTIEFSLKTRSHVTLTVYNVLGREVAKIVDEVRSAGRHVVQWNGKDVGGSPVASGVYLYRLSVGDRTEIRKMVLLK